MSERPSEQAATFGGRRTGTRSRQVLATALCALFAGTATTQARANEYSPAGFYEVEHIVLENGFEVVLKERGDAHNVAIRVIVDVGLRDFPCGRRETPHFLEHLLFAGTSKHDETELEQLVEERGGSWNAFTESERTSYHLDIYSGNALFGIDVLHEILSDSLISAEHVALTRSILQRESSSPEISIMRNLYARGFGKTGFTKIYEALGLACPNYETTHEITRDDLLAAYEHYYRPSNMTLVAVGQFDHRALLSAIRERFGSLESGAVPERPIHSLETATGNRVFTSTLAPLIGNEAEVGISVAHGGYRSPDYYPLSVLAGYLDGHLYEIVRSKRGLSYAPYAAHFSLSDRGIFYAGADASLADAAGVLYLVRKEAGRLATQPLDPARFERTKMAMLLSAAGGMEANSDLADYYVGALHELHDFGHFLNWEDRIEEVTPHDVQELARRLFVEGEVLEFVNEPTLSYESLAAGMLSIAALPLVVGGLWWWRRR